MFETARFTDLLYIGLEKTPHPGEVDFPSGQVHSEAKRPKNGSFRLFWYSLYISSPNLAY